MDQYNPSNTLGTPILLRKLEIDVPIYWTGINNPSHTHSHTHTLGGEGGGEGLLYIITPTPRQRARASMSVLLGGIHYFLLSLDSRGEKLVYGNCIFIFFFAGLVWFLGFLSSKHSWNESCSMRWISLLLLFVIMIMTIIKVRLIPGMLCNSSWNKIGCCIETKGKRN